MIDVHIHAVPPNLPGVGPLHPLLRLSPEHVAVEIRRQMELSGTTLALSMGEFDAGAADPLGVARTLQIAERVPGLKAIGIADPTKTDRSHFAKCDEILATGRVVALKGYLGYLYFEPAHPNYRPYYELAAKHKIPFMFHTGDTYSPLAKLRFAHPLGVDEVAVDHPTTRFVMCHLGNPWTIDCAEVIYKNMNVWADLSGLLVGSEAELAMAEGREAAVQLGYTIRNVIRYSERPNRFLYGTDWPLTPMPTYRDFIASAVPTELAELIFQENARSLFRLI